MSTHARLSPSSASRWLNCPGSVALCDGLPDTSSSYADVGTAAHTLAEMCFAYKKDAKFYIGEIIRFGETEIIVDEDMASAVQVYLDYVRRLPDTFSVLHEQRLPLTPLTGEEDAFGTADTLAFDRDTLMVIDYKNGRGVEVDALDNEQMMMYAAAARAEYSILGEFIKFKVIIVQPNCDNISEFEFTGDDLDIFVERVQQVSSVCLKEQVVQPEHLNPSEKSCRFCKAKAICPALAKKVIDATSSGFDNLDSVGQVDLAESMALTDLVEDWARAVRAEVERRLLTGVKVAGWKIVRGRMGARQWSDEAEVITKLKDQMRYADDLIFSKKLLSATQLEKKIGKEHPKHWAELQSLIIRKEGSPSVAPESDERPALDVSSSFEVLT
jgi:Protein of unknown function (DUF2800)